MISAAQSAKILKKSLEDGFKQKNGFVYKELTEDFYLMIHFYRSKYDDIFYIEVSICTPLMIGIDRNNKFKYFKCPSMTHELDGCRINCIHDLGFASDSIPTQREKIEEFAKIFSAKYDKVVEPYFLSILKNNYDKENTEAVGRLVEKHYPSMRCVDIGHMLHKWGFYDEAVWLYECHDNVMKMYPHEMKALIAAAKNKKFLSIDELYGEA